MPASRASIVIPAHQEEATIGRCLDAFAHADLDLEVVVAANGCTDRTVEIASTYRGVRVLDLPQGGKAAALNEADKVATVFPRMYVDADVVVTGVSALVDALSGESPALAVPSRALDLGDASTVLRGYYRAGNALRQCRGDQLGTGVYAVNASGRQRWGDFPDGIADDYHVHTRFQPGERLTVPGARSLVRPPRNVSSLLSVRSRVYAGNNQHQQHIGRLQRSDKAFRHLASDPVALLALPIYAALTLEAKRRANRDRRRGNQVWARDVSARG